MQCCGSHSRHTCRETSTRTLPTNQHTHHSCCVSHCHGADSHKGRSLGSCITLTYVHSSVYDGLTRTCSVGDVLCSWNSDSPCWPFSYHVMNMHRLPVQTMLILLPSSECKRLQKRPRWNRCESCDIYWRGNICLQITMLHTWHGSQQCPDLAFHRLTTYSPSIRKKEKKKPWKGENIILPLCLHGFDQNIYAWPLGKTHVDFSAPYTNLYWETIFE